MSFAEETDLTACTELSGNSKDSLCDSAEAINVRRRLRPDADELPARSSRPKSLHELPKLKVSSKKTIWSRMKSSAAKQINKIKHKTKDSLLVPSDRELSSSQPELSGTPEPDVERRSFAALRHDTKSESLHLSPSGRSLASSIQSSPLIVEDIRRSATLGRLGRQDSDATAALLSIRCTTSVIAPAAAASMAARAAAASMAAPAAAASMAAPAEAASMAAPAEAASVAAAATLPPAIITRLDGSPTRRRRTEPRSTAHTSCDLSTQDAPVRPGAELELTMQQSQLQLQGSQQLAALAQAHVVDSGVQRRPSRECCRKEDTATSLKEQHAQEDCAPPAAELRTAEATAKGSGPVVAAKCEVLSSSELLAKERSQSETSLAGSCDLQCNNEPPAFGYCLHVTLVRGVELAARDSNGLSDPYVKLRAGGRTKFKSRIVYKSLNPQWNERFTLQLYDLREPVMLCVFDHDTFTHDDDMGFALIHPSSLQLGCATELILPLEGAAQSTNKGGSKRSVRKKSADSDEKLGHLVVICELVPATCILQQPSMAATPSSSLGSLVPQTELLTSSRYEFADGSPRFMSRKSTCTDSNRSLSPPKSEQKDVNIALLEGRDLLPMDSSGFSDPFVRFRLGRAKLKSTVKKQTLCPKWQEEFNMRMYPEDCSMLEIEVYDYNVATRAAFIGRASIDLSVLIRDKTHRIEQQLDDKAGVIVLLITITNRLHGDSDSFDSCSAEVQADASERSITRHLAERYELRKSFRNMTDVGWLTVTVHRAQNLPAKDWDGKSDPFCVLELVNTRLQTHTVYGTLNPEWQRTFTMDVKDIHSVLEVTVYDEDNDSKREFIGKVAIPLLQARRGRQIWYSLKDHKLMRRSKGELLIEINFAYNPVRAALRTFNPPEQKLMQHQPKFKIRTFKTHATRVKAILDAIFEAKNFWQSLIDWDVPSRTVIAFFLFVIVVWHFRPFMVPLGLLLLYGWTYLTHRRDSNSQRDSNDAARTDGEAADDDDDSDDDDDETAVNDYGSEQPDRRFGVLSSIDKLRSTALDVQNVLNYIASFGERVKNSVNWSVPWLSSLAVMVLAVATVILYLIPLRYIILLWGINKFTKKLRQPNYVPNNELLDYLSRIPTDQEKILYSEIDRQSFPLAAGGKLTSRLGPSNRSSPVSNKAASSRPAMPSKR